MSRAGPGRVLRPSLICPSQKVLAEQLGLALHLGLYFLYTLAGRSRRGDVR